MRIEFCTISSSMTPNAPRRARSGKRPLAECASPDRASKRGPVCPPSPLEARSGILTDASLPVVRSLLKASIPPIRQPLVAVGSLLIGRALPPESRLPAHSRSFGLFWVPWFLSTTVVGTLHCAVLGGLAVALVTWPQHFPPAQLRHWIRVGRPPRLTFVWTAAPLEALWPCCRLRRRPHWTLQGPTRTSPPRRQVL